MLHDVAFDISGGMPAPAPMIPSTRGTLPPWSIVELAALAASLAFSTHSRFPSLRGWPSAGGLDGAGTGGLASGGG
jgi:hypothetical protein